MPRSTGIISTRSRALAILVLAIGLWILLHRTRPGDTTAINRSARAPEFRESNASLAGHGDARPEGPGDLEAASPFGTLGRPDFPVAHVEVLSADGVPVEGALVFALPAGAPGADDIAEMSHARTDAGGICALRVLRSQAYDVGVRTPQDACMLVEGRTMEAGTRITVRMPALERVLVRTDDPDLRLATPTDPVWVRLYAKGLGTGAAYKRYPGRGETPRVVHYAMLHQGNGGATELALAADRVWGVASAEWHRPLPVTPTEFRPPATVQVHAALPYALEVTARFRPTGSSWPYDAEIRAEFSFDADTLGDRVLVARLPSTRVLGFAPETRREVWLSQPSGTLGWSGPGLRSGTATFANLKADARNTMTIWIDVDSPPAVVTVPGLVDRHVTVRMSEDGTESGPMDASWTLWRRDGQVGGNLELPAAPLSASFGASGWDDDWVRVETDDREWIVGPVRLADAGRGPLVLRRSGHLRVEVLLPAGGEVGAVTMERLDGGPLGVLGDRSSTTGRPVTLRPDTVVGPLEPGPHTVRVRVGGQVLGTYDVVVEARRTATLRIEID